MGGLSLCDFCIYSIEKINFVQSYKIQSSVSSQWQSCIYLMNSLQHLVTTLDKKQGFLLLGAWWKI
jgi:hypothetical protein